MKQNLLQIVFVFCAGLLAQERVTAQETMKIDIINTERKEVGQATIADGPNGIVITLSLREKPAGIPPGAHGFHIHAVGKCEPPFKSAGDHFAPQKRGHGFLSKSGRHAGDLPNIHVPENGTLTVEFFVPDVRLKGKNALLDEDGAALVIHAKPDDYHSDPSGEAGDRLACGVIGSAAKTTKSK